MQRLHMDLPIGPAVTFLFTDIEGSTRLERAIGSAAWSAVVARHDALMRGAIEAAGGVVVKTEGDAFFAAFGEPDSGVRAAIAAQRAIAADAWPVDATIRVRMGLHSGEVISEEGDYFGKNVILAARIAAQALGGEILVSEELRQVVSSTNGDSLQFDDGRELELKGLAGSHRVYRAEWAESDAASSASVA